MDDLYLWIFQKCAIPGHKSFLALVEEEIRTAQSLQTRGDLDEIFQFFG